MSQEPNIVRAETETDGGYPHRVSVRSHVFRTDVGTALGGEDSAPDAHDYFDGALASCKALTAVWYARQKSIPLERVDVEVVRDDHEERAGKYTLRVRLNFHGNLTDDDRKRLHAAVARCPVHKLMTTTEVTIETLSP